MIKSSDKGFAVFSKDGKKRLSKWYATKPEAEKRLREIEYFKHNQSKIVPTKLEKYPTQQAGRVRSAKADIARRIKSVRQPILDLIDSIPVREVTINEVRYQYELDADRLLNIDSEINRLINEALQTNSNRPAQRWFFSQYIDPAYQDGTTQSAARIEALAISSGQVDEFTASQLQMQNILFSEPYRRRIELLNARSFENMKGFANENASKLGRILGDGVGAGKSPRAIAREMKREFSFIEGFRALRIARTETNKAFTQARSEQTKDARDRLGLEIKLMHVSALVQSTRSSHAFRHGKLYTPEAQEEWWSTGSNRINCLCSTVEILYLNGEALQKDLIQKQRERGKAYFSG